MLKNDFVPVAIDQWFQRRQQDDEGDFWRKIASQGPRNDFQLTTQGRYIATADGQLLGYNNNRGPQKIRQLMHRSLKKFESLEADSSSLKVDNIDSRAQSLPETGTLVIRVNAKILEGYKKTTAWTRVFHDSISRDNLWILEDELPELVQNIENGGEVSIRIASRIARFHLVDNTRGEPPRWKNSEIKQLKMSIDENGSISGTFHLETDSGDRGYQGRLLGKATTKDGTLTQFDMIAKGHFWGSGEHTHYPPEGKFPLAIAFRIAADSDPADKIMPHGSKGWLRGYIESDRH